MKKLFTLIAFLTLSMSYAQTTQTEYNYVTKGLRIQIESGLDMKKGYSIDSLTNHFVGGRNMSFFALMKGNEKVPCAIICYYTRESTGFTDYICIPHFDSSKEIWLQANKKISSYGLQGSQALNWGLMKMAAYYSKQ